MATTVNLTDYCSQNGSNIKFTIVKDSDSEYFDQVIEAIKKLHTANENVISEIHSNECFEMNEYDLANKRYIFILDKFDSAEFKHLADIKEVYIFGPKCVLSIISENLEVPATLFQIHNLCMKGLILCFSSVRDSQKKSCLKKLIGYMGGLYSNSLTEDITHLVTEDVFSKKYHHAGSHNIQIMHPSWIDEIWKLSQVNNFSQTANSPEFLEKYQLKMFYNLMFASTGLKADEKKQIIKLIEDNGGEYSHVFKTATVKVLIMKEQDVNSLKYKASKKHSIHCIDPEWIIDSVAAGYALNIENYFIKNEGKIKSSTPTKNTSGLEKFAFDNTMLSDITDLTARSIAIDETQKSSNARGSLNLPQQRKFSLRPSTSKSSLKLTQSNVLIKSKDETFKKPALPTRKTIASVPSPPKFEYPEEDESFIQILVDKTICLYGYTNDIDSMQVIEECEKIGARLVDLSYKKTIDYVITPAELLDMKLPNIKFNNLVTDVWLEESVEIGRCIEPLKFYHHSIFKPLEQHQVLKDEIFVCSNYEISRQRPFIRQLVNALGGISKEALSRSEGATLICPAAEGKKYDGARNWGLTVLSAEWLLKCYQKKTRFDETDYLIGDTKVSTKNKAKRDSIIPSSQEIDDVHCSPVRRRDDDFQEDPKTPDNNASKENDKRIGNLSWLLEDMPTPQREVTKAVLLKQQKQKQQQKMSPRTKLLKDLMETPENAMKSIDYQPSPAPDLPELLLPIKDATYGLPGASPASQWYYKRKVEALDDRYVEISNSRRKALKDVAVTPPYSHIRYDFFKKRLIDYDSPDPRKDNFEETQKLYMARITANMSNEASKFLNFEDTESDGVAKQPDVQPFDSDIMKLDEVLKQVNESNKVKSLQEINESRSQKEGFIPLKVPPSIIDYYPKEDLNLVRWANSQHVEEKFPSVNNDEAEKVAEKEVTDEESESILVSSGTQERIFAISSGNHGEDKQQLIDKIESLGGKLTEFNFTHLIMTKVSKSSKYFSALASGKFILHADYVDASVEQNRFINTDPFEFGHPKFQCIVSNVKESLLIDGPYRCRQLVKNNPEKFENGLFTGMNFIVVASADKIQQFISVIESGGGTIVDEKPEFKLSVLKRSKIDYCLVENLKSLSKKDIETLKSCSIQVKNIKFIYEYLLSENSFVSS